MKHGRGVLIMSPLSIGCGHQGTGDIVQCWGEGGMECSGCVIQEM